MMTIWTVNLGDDRNHLTARLLRSFKVYGWEQGSSLSLYGERLLRGRDDTRILEVFDWPRCSSQIHQKAVLRPSPYADVGYITRKPFYAN